MATKKRSSPIYEIQNFANTYLGNVSKFQGNSLFRFGVLNHLLGWRWKTAAPVIKELKYWAQFDGGHIIMVYHTLVFGVISFISVA